MERTSRGYTLVEALVVLALIGVLASLSISGLRQLANSTRLSSAANDMLADLFLARSEAIKRRLGVVMCKSGDGASCAAGGSWQQGWIVFVDADADGQRAALEHVLRVQPALPGALRLTGTSTMAKYVRYAPTGAARSVGGGFQAGTLTVCSEPGGSTTGRQIVISSSGRPRTQKASLANCN